MKLRRNLKGFTLVELLVVIAIIGILSTLALVSLNGARNKANNARVMSDVVQIRNRILKDTSDKADFTGVGFLTTDPKNACNSNALYSMTSSTSAFSVSGILCGGAGYFCADSSGRSTTTGSAVSTVACP